MVLAVMGAAAPTLADAQLIDRTTTPNTANEGIARSLADQIGTGRGDLMTPDSSLFIIGRDPFRAIRRGRQLFQRKFNRDQGQGPLVSDGTGSIDSNAALGAGLVDSCAGCHGRPRGSAGSGGNVATRPDSRDAPHLFGAGLKEMLGDEITADLRRLRDGAITEAHAGGRPVTRSLVSKGINYGAITARPDGTVDTSKIQGVDPDLRVRPFFAHGSVFSLRTFIVGALQDEMGLQALDPDVLKASKGDRVVTPAGMILDGALDRIAIPSLVDDVDGDRDRVRHEIEAGLVDFLEFYLLNYFKPGTGEHTAQTRLGRRLFEKVGCQACHVPDLPIERDRRVADVETVFDPVRGIFNRLFATATALFRTVEDGSGLPSQKVPRLGPFLVKDIFTDLRRHDLGPNFHERNYNGTIQTLFMTAPLWGVGTTAPYGHDGRSISLLEVIRRHGGEAQGSRNAFVALPPLDQAAVLDFLNSLILFPPDDTASNLNPGNPATPGFPQFGHGSISLGVLFNNPKQPE
jgi:mono/diheme cytochrome c family protein